MTGSEAYWFTLGLITCLLVLVLPAMPLLMGAPAGAVRRRSLRAGAGGWAAGIILATAIAWAIPIGPLRAAADRAPDDAAILIAISAGLAVILAAVGSCVTILYRDLGLMRADQVRATAAMIGACWLVVVGTFAFLLYG